MSVNKFFGWFANTGPTSDFGNFPVNMAGTASVVVCEVANTFRYHVDVPASSAKPGNRFAFTSPCVFNSEKSGASSNTIHNTLILSCGVPGPATVDDVGF